MSQNYTNRIKRIAQIGLISKGIIYIIFGILIMMAVFGDGEKHIQLFGILKYIMTLGLAGRILVILLAIGLLNYSLWKLLQMVLNTENCPKNFHGYFIRITWIGPFIFYLILGGHAIIQTYNWYGGEFTFDFEIGGIKEMVYTTEGRLLIAFVSISLFINAVSLFYLSLTGKYVRMLTGNRLYLKSPHLAKLTGFMGYFFYGLALLIISFLFALSLYTYNSSMAHGGLSMFGFLKSQAYGVGLLIAISAGTICYGLYFFVVSFYRWSGEDLSIESSMNTGK